MKRARRTDRIRAHYETRVDPACESHDILDWGSREAQFARFQVFYDVLVSAELHSLPAAQTLLDVGCGLCDLRTFLWTREVYCRYVGVDITPTILQEAHRRHPDTSILLADVFQEAPFRDRTFTTVFCSGTLNLRLDNNEAFADIALRAMIGLASRLVVVNFLHQRTVRKYEHCHYYCPDEIHRIAAANAPEGTVIRLIDDYLANDFTVAIHLPSRP